MSASQACRKVSPDKVHEIVIIVGHVPDTGRLHYFSKHILVMFVSLSLIKRNNKKEKL